MTKAKLKKLKEGVIKHNNRWIEKGGKLTSYFCKNCCQEIPTRQPKKKDVSSKGYWDSAMICFECGKLNFVIVYPNGNTIAKRFF
jgi:hypothetical protein